MHLAHRFEESASQFLLDLEFSQILKGVHVLGVAFSCEARFEYVLAATLRMHAEQHFEAASIIRWHRRDRQIELDRWADDGGRAS